MYFRWHLIPFALFFPKISMSPCWSTHSFPTMMLCMVVVTFLHEYLWPELLNSRWAEPIGMTCRYFPRNFEVMVNSCQQVQSRASQICATIGGWWLTCSDKERQPRSSVRSHSYVSPNRGLKGLPVLTLVVAYDDMVNAATYASCSQGSATLKKKGENRRSLKTE